MAKVRTRDPHVAVLVGVAPVAASCSSNEGAAQRADAEKLVSAAHAAGVAPGLTVSVAESLYGTSAPQVCDALGGGVSPTEQQPPHRRTESDPMATRAPKSAPQPYHAVRRVTQFQALAFSEIYDWLKPGQLLDGTANPRFLAWWDEASAESFRPWSASERAHVG